VQREAVGGKKHIDGNIFNGCLMVKQNGRIIFASHACFVSLHALA
jgi:hypothetical protein